jgi:peptidoglycan/LPS O-acetylase OafA/YrhL
VKANKPVVVRGSQVLAPGRLDSLDSLRGLAALTVVFNHVMWLYKPDGGLRRKAVHSVGGWRHLLAVIHGLPGTFLFEISPLHFFASGHEAVVLFFILSGFVLYLPWKAKRAPTYTSFLVKRVCRIYLPYLASLIFVIFLNAKLSEGGLAGMNQWFDKTWSLPVTWQPVLQHLVLLDSFDTDRFSPPIWSLVQEMRISLIFPLIALLVLYRRRWVPAVALVLSATGIALTTLVGPDNNYFITLHYAACFILGAVLAHYRELTCAFYSRLAPRTRGVFLLAALSLYTYGRAVTWLPRVPASVGDAAIGAGAAMVIVWAQSDPWILHLRAAKWLGKVSYGLYLTHLGIIFGCIYLCHAWMPLWLILCIAVPIALAASEIFYRLIEKPSILLGRRLSKLAERSGQSVPSSVEVA